MMYFIVFIAGLLTILGVKFFLLKPRKEKTEVLKEAQEPRSELTVADIIKIADLNNTAKINLLMVEYNVENEIPAFFDKYQALMKENRDVYFRGLVDVFSKDKPDYVKNLMDNHPELSLQDILLLLMINMRLDNKSMARLMILSIDTLKKRKTRLKAKVRHIFPDMENALFE